MQAAALVDRLECNAGVLRALLAGVGEEQARWKPDAARWSVLEVASHLLDEEREDFRARLRLVLESPSAPWPPIDPGGWVVDRRYAERDLAATAASFLAERAQSVAWLRSLSDPPWEAAHRHPQLGDLTAGDLLTSWVAHDALHVRQLAGLHHGWIARLGEPHSPAYAGEW